MRFTLVLMSCACEVKFTRETLLVKRFRSYYYLLTFL